MTKSSWFFLLSLSLFCATASSDDVQPLEIRYGQRQVDQILDDRPDMKNADTTGFYVWWKKPGLMK